MNNLVNRRIYGLCRLCAYITRIIYLICWLIFGFENIKNPIPNSHCLFRVTGNKIFPNSLYHAHVLNSLQTFLSFFLPICWSVSFPLRHFLLSSRLNHAIIKILLTSHLLWNFLSLVFTPADSLSLASRSHRITLLNPSLSHLWTLSPKSQSLDLLLSTHCWKCSFNFILYLRFWTKINIKTGDLKVSSRFQFEFEYEIIFSILLACC